MHMVLKKHDKKAKILNGIEPAIGCGFSNEICTTSCEDVAKNLTCGLNMKRLSVNRP
jgi:hypothetical protein